MREDYKRRKPEDKMKRMGFIIKMLRVISIMNRVKFYGDRTVDYMRSTVMILVATNIDITCHYV